MLFKNRLYFIYPFLFLSFLIFQGAASSTADEPIKAILARTLNRFNTFHHPESELSKIRKCEIQLSEDGFLRYRKTFINGKQEYYSFNLSRLHSMDYYGSIISGELSITTEEDDVIVQTFNDRSGNVDTMATYFHLPVHGLTAEDLNSIQTDLLEIKKRLQ